MDFWTVILGDVCSLCGAQKEAKTCGYYNLFMLHLIWAVFATIPIAEHQKKMHSARGILVYTNVVSKAKKFFMVLCWATSSTANTGVYPNYELWVQLWNSCVAYLTHMEVFQYTSIPRCNCTCGHNPSLEECRCVHSEQIYRFVFDIYSNIHIIKKTTYNKKTYISLQI